MKTNARFLPAAAVPMLAAFSLTGISTAGEETVTDADLLLARNPIVIKSRVRVADEYTDLDGGGSRNKFILAGVYGFGFNGHDRQFGIGFELPVLENDPEGADSDTGLGDLKLRVGHLLMDDPAGWRAGWFFETEFDTAADDVQAIANQRTQMAGGAGAAYAIRDNFVLATSLQFGWSADQGDTTGNKSEWEGHLTATWKISPCVSLNLDYKGVVNMMEDAELYNTLEPSIGWTVGNERNIGLFASCEIPLDDSSTNCIAKAGVTWFF
ncbi:transporter [Luteolibacter yonseiensis]|uniref:Transporter n=1 Tax=Luteolibacter yonseiensis TaxID=1144680 RepID=A0A934R3G3_9BACT|nr:transporter [Luteolibacter yonseiensis]MBK1814534.1 transporter [Luteolibacter yonseiensis]